MKSLFIPLFIFLFISDAFTQSDRLQAYNPSGMTHWEPFIGQWKGIGWRLTEDGQQTEWHHAYNIQFKLDGRLLMLENTTTVKDEVHHKSIILGTYDENANNFPLRVYSTLTPEGDYSGVFEHGAFIYFMNKNLRFSMQVNEKGQIYEIGEMKMGDQWVQVFEMLSSKVD
ncbi:hypothetical protein [Mongoliitalea lutea]|uniref:DUF1579 domain-containing protein n=1 Tax=Mongoliitalea lutea TaxID=849756 RepID=A0A8J3G728_9BACT|nr:hypothetical protein [Mongoliitalea lutea]GHB48931.1 hypothetical protein GCM10008106_32120 [Mongoliitalea lutea]